VDKGIRAVTVGGTNYGVGMSDQPDTTTGHPVAQLCRRFADRLDELVEPGSLTLWSADDAAVTEVITAAEDVIRKAMAVQTVAVGEAGRRDLAKNVGATSTTAWLADVLTARRAKAQRVTELAEQLSRGLAATNAAFAAGSIDAEQATVIAEAVHTLPDALGAAVIAQGEHLMLEWAGQHSAQVLAGYGCHLLAFLAPEIADAQDAEALARAEARDAQRNNTVSAGPDHRAGCGSAATSTRSPGRSCPRRWNRSRDLVDCRARTATRTTGPRVSGVRTRWSRSADGRWPRPIPRPVTGSPPMSPSPSATSS